MIIRIYRVQVKPDLRQDFENEFQKISDEFVSVRDGLISVSIGRSLNKQRPGEYCMVTLWKDLQSVESFAGEDWDQPVIPPHMKRFSIKCWLDNYLSLPESDFS